MRKNVWAARIKIIFVSIICFSNDIHYVEQSLSAQTII